MLKTDQEWKNLLSTSVKGIGSKILSACKYILSARFCSLIMPRLDEYKISSIITAKHIDAILLVATI